MAGLGRFAQYLALAIETAQCREVLARAERFVAELQAKLATAARCQAVVAGIIAEFGGGPAGRHM